MSEYEIVVLDPHNVDHIRGVSRLSNAIRNHGLSAYPETNPTRELSSRWFTTKYTRRLEWLAVKEDQIVGHVDAQLSTEDNQHLAEMWVEVHPEHRRQGIGSALLKLAEKTVTEEGRDTFLTWLIDSYPDGAQFDHSGQAFAPLFGYKQSNIEVQRRNDLFAVDEDELDKLWAESWEKAQDYELIEYVDQAPEEIIEGLCILAEGMYTDVPLGETDIREAEFTPERLRARQQALADRAVTMLHAVVRHKPTGEIAGNSEISIFPGMEKQAFQGDTIVHKTHRGHRLGMILKIANQRALRAIRPQIQCIDTWNAESNEHMIAINEAIGYRKLARELEMQKKLDN